MKIKITIHFTILLFVATILNANAQVDNTFTGENSGVNNTGSFNTGYGKNTLSSNTSNSNNAFGFKTLSNSTGGFNCAFGNEALALNGSGTLNCSLGTRTLYNNDSGAGNIAVGHRALESNVEGNYNTAVGYFSLLKNIGNRNIAMGYYTPRHLKFGDDNIFIGSESAINLIRGNYNVFLGNRIAVSNAPSTSLLAGSDTSQSIIFADGMGNQRIFIHKNGNTGIGLGNNVIPVNKLDIKGAVAIGKSFTPNGSTPGIIAPVNGLLVEGNVGIGTTAPNNKVEISSGITGKSGLRFTNLTSNYNPPSTEVNNKFLTVNQNGDVVLQKNAEATNLLTSSANLMTSNVNNIISSASIVNSITNQINTSNQLITTVNGVASAPVNLPQNNFTELDGDPSNELQTLSQTGNTITLSNGGGSFTLPSTSITAGTNVTVSGNGTSASPFVIAAGDTSLYANNGTINAATTTSGNRIVTMNNQNIWFKSAATDTNGKIYIGKSATFPSTSGNYKLLVEGGILTEKVKVALRSTANWADYVFEKNYDLMPLKNVEEYIATYKHLPGIDSAETLSKNGLDLAEMQAKQMAKIEELMLYIIEQNKTIEALKKQVDALTAKQD